MFFEDNLYIPGFKFAQIAGCENSKNKYTLNKYNCNLNFVL